MSRTEAKSPGARLRALFADGPFTVMGAHDPMSARIAEAEGAKAIYVSGFALSAVIAGAPDFGVLTQTEMLEAIRRICRATSLPVFADADTGYGGPLEARRTIELWEEAGVAALHLEDQQAPKKCGHFAGKALIPTDEMAQKLRAMVEARRDPNFFIVARTDAIAVEGIDAAIARLRAYAQTGVDGLYADAPESIEHMRMLPEGLSALGLPILFNMASSGKSPVVTLEEAGDLGFAWSLCPIESMLTSHRAVTQMMRRFLKEPTTAAIVGGMTPFADFNDFIGLEEMAALNARYAAR